MRRRFVTVDVFTDRIFGGNPLAVVLDPQGLSADQMQVIAREFGYSETTFVLPPADRANTAQVRIFTPVNELPFAGHPNVGTAVALAQDMAERGETVPECVLFEEGAGLVPVRLLRSGESVDGAEFAAPRTLDLGATLEPDRVASCVGLSGADIRTERFHPVVASVGLPFVVAELASRDALRRARPDAAGMAALLPVEGSHSVFVMTSDADVEGCDWMSRMFAPMGGIAEDPATGSATAAAAALLGSLQPDLGPIRIAQGVDMGRPSMLTARVSRVDGRLTAHVGGSAVTVLRGTLDLPGAAV